MNTKIALLSALVPVSIGLVMASTAPAKASQLTASCGSGPHEKIYACCKSWVAQHGTPIWMDSAGSSCNTAVVCVDKGRRSNCHVEISNNTPKGSRPGESGGGNNNNGGGNNNPGKP